MEVNSNESKNKKSNLSRVLDTADFNTYCNNLRFFSKKKPVENKCMILDIGDSESPIEGNGSVKFYIKVYNKSEFITLSNVMYTTN